MVTEPLSFSRLSAFSRCALSYRLRWVDHVPEETNGAGLAGKIIHEMIAEAEVGEDWASEEPWGRKGPKAEEFARRLLSAVEDIGAEKIRWGGRKRKEFPEGENAAWWCFEGPIMLARYAAIRRRDVERGWVVASTDVERYVAANLDELLVRGYVDAVLMVTPDGEPIIRDWKTGTFVDPFQLAVYGWLLGQTGPMPVTGEIGYLRGSKAEQWIKTYDLRPWTGLVAPMFRDLGRSLALAQEHDLWPLTPNMMCPSCVVRHHCPWGATLDEEPADA